MSQTEKYVPQMCAYCPNFFDDDVRDEKGRKGYCVVLHEDVHHIDWCHEENEKAQHKYYMSIYVDCGSERHKNKQKKERAESNGRREMHALP